jgi:hypothetical protein
MHDQRNEPMSLTSLHTYFDPTNYHPDAVAAAEQGAVESLDRPLILIRLGIELYRDDRAAVYAILSRLDEDVLEGYALWQKLTAALILALQSLHAPSIIGALDVWFEGRARFPGNWRNEVLDAPEVFPWLSDIDPAKLIPPTPKRRRIKQKERAFVKDVKSVCEKAVADNLIFLRELGATQSESALVKRYKLVSVNLNLRECNFGAGDVLPEIIVAFDAEGQYLGSFLSH